MNRFSIFTLLACAAAAATAQQPASFVPPGSYVLAEQGTSQAQPLASLTVINVAADGTIAGTQAMRTLASLSKSRVTGVATLNSDQTVMLTLTATAADADGNPLTSTESFILLPGKLNEFTALRVDNGISSIGSFAAAGSTSPIRGNFILSESGISGSYAHVGAFGFDGSGNVTGFELVQTTGVNSRYNFNGKVAQGFDGFSAMTINVPSVDTDGNAAFTQENYVVAPTASGLKAMRIDAGFADVANLTAR